MDFIQPITNNLKKFVSSLKSKKERDSQMLFIVEGEKMCEELLKSKYKTEMIVLRSNFSQTTGDIAVEFDRMNVPVYVARKQQFDQLCDTVTPQDILAIADMSVEEGIEIENFIALDGIADPGNMGTIIRTSDWFGFRNIILGGDCVDKYNSKVVRASMGSLFRMNIFQVGNLSEYLNENYKTFEIFGASLKGKKQLHNLKPKGKFGVVFGNEVHGISNEVKRVLTSEFIIPGYGTAESLNVAVSAGVVMNHLAHLLHE